jgi:hypothetical protein
MLALLFSASAAGIAASPCFFRDHFEIMASVQFSWSIAIWNNQDFMA